jgi:predicted AlkP superfamily phosphohydrolase/phosphomutase
MNRRPFAPALLAALLAVVAAGCGRPAAGPPPVLVVGVDGAELTVIERLWAEGRLPNLRRMADRGAAFRLETIHHASPVIWTSIATGVRPEVHGITDFAVPTAGGDQPTSSTLRRVPALWNMATAAGRRSAVIGWWATWPAEDVNGVVVSDRALSPLDGRVSPAAFLDRFRAIESAARAAPGRFGGNEATRLQDQVMTATARELCGAGFDLVAVYLRSIDIACHFDWKFLEPEAFGGLDPAEVAAGRERIAAAYEAADQAVGALRETIGPAATVVVLSDHGFHAMEREELRVLLDLDAVLAGLGLLERAGDRVDMARSLVYTYASPSHLMAKKVRFCLAGREPGGTVAEGDRPAVRARLEAALGRVAWAGGSPALRLRDPSAKERRGGADLVVEVLEEGAAAPLLADGRPLAGAAPQISRLSGTHGRTTAGVLFADGPAIAPGAAPAGMTVLDVAPTLLYAMGLPTAESFDGQARLELFRESFRRRHPLHTIPTWGAPRDGQGTASAVDQAIIEELAALGYIE